MAVKANSDWHRACRGTGWRPNCVRSSTRCWPSSRTRRCTLWLRARWAQRAGPVRRKREAARVHSATKFCSARCGFSGRNRSWTRSLRRSASIKTLRGVSETSGRRRLLLSSLLSIRRSWVMPSLAALLFSGRVCPILRARPDAVELCRSQAPYPGCRRRPVRNQFQNGPRKLCSRRKSVCAQV